MVEKTDYGNLKTSALLDTITNLEGDELGAALEELYKRMPFLYYTGSLINLGNNSGQLRSKIDKHEHSKGGKALFPAD